VRAGRHQVRLETTVLGRAATGEVGDVERVVGLAIVVPQPSVPLARTPSDAPTAITFLPVAGGDTVSGELPPLPAANTSTIS